MRKNHWAFCFCVLAFLIIGSACSRYTPNGSQVADQTGPGTGGSGGPKGSIVDSLTISHAGLSTQYRVYAPQTNSVQTPQNLVIFLHGDGGSNFGPQSLDPRIIRPTGAYGQPRPTIDQAVFEGQQDSHSIWNDTIFVAVLSPTLNAEYFTWDTGLDEQTKAKHVALLDFLVHQEIFPKYNVDTRHIFWIGQSGGSNFVGGTLLQAVGNSYHGGSIMLCGGLPAASTQNFDEEFKRNYRLSFQTTGGDYPELREGIDQAIAVYRPLLGETHVGFNVNGDDGHCLFPTQSQPKLLEPILRQMLN